MDLDRVRRPPSPLSRRPAPRHERRDAAAAPEVVVDREFGEILGAHMIGVGPTGVIGQVALAMELGADCRDLPKVRHLHPSLAELVTDTVASVE